MSKVTDLLSELRQVTERSKPNTMYNDQIRLIEAIEIALDEESDGSSEESVVKNLSEDKEKVIDNSDGEVLSEKEPFVKNDNPTPQKRGRKSSKQN